MRVLVAYASRHGATAGIAERIASVLTASGVDAELRRADEVTEVREYDAYVVGGSAYMYRWAKESAGFVRRNAALLAQRPVWLFTSGPLGTDLVDAQGRDVREASVPREFPDLAALVHPRDQRVFFGAYDPAAPPVGIAERLTRLMPAARDAIPAGDFRDWEAIESWARGIAQELGALPSPAPA